jgi:hypothetical protein
MARDIGTARTALQSRLGNLSGVVAYDVATGNENTRANNTIIQIFPAPAPGGFWPGHPGDACPVRLNFIIQLWASIAAGIDKAQDRIDGFLSPSGTHDNSIEGILEDPDGTYDGDTFDVLVQTVKVDQFTTYGFGALNSTEANSIMATIPVELLLAGA